MAPLGSTAQRRLTAARLVSANIFSAFSQITVDMPEGYFGGADVVTAPGLAYLGWLVVMTSAVMWGLATKKPKVVYLMWLMLCVNIGLFISPLATAPVIAGVTILWNLAVLGWIIVPFERGDRTYRIGGQITEEDGPLEVWQRRWAPAVRHLLLVSLVLNTAVFGYHLSEQWLAFGLTLVFALSTVILSVPPLIRMIRRGRWVLLVMILPLVLSAFFLQSPDILLLLVGFFQLIALVVFYLRAPVMADLLEYFYAYPAILLLLTFASLTLLGTLLLSLPAASATGQPVSAIDALFTSTSASCITGLIVLDTPVDFSTFGHVVILFLFQIGGIGILVISTFATLLLGSKLGLRAEQAMGEVFDRPGAESTYALARFIVTSTLIIESVGAILLTWSFSRLGYPLPEAIWQGIFHAVSAFCHAGFALHSGSMMIFENDPLALAVLVVLITLGSVGFLVLAVAWDRMQGHRIERRRVNIEARMIVVASAFLLLLGFVLFLFTEWNASMAGMTAPERVFNALFQSATMRSAGFNSVDTTLFTDATIWYSIGLMIIGGAPASMGGGIKVTTFVIMVMAVRGIAMGRPRVVLFKRQISQEVVYRSAAIIILYVLLFFLLLFLLLLTQSLPFEMLAFEAASGLGTVGISVGATPQLNAVGKVLLILIIFVGRVGPLALALVLGRRSASRIDYPETRVMVG